jgi:nucleoside-diphosphate-sugar epimerase
VLERWGGQAVVLPYLTGKSTTSLIQEAATRAFAPPVGTVLVTGAASGLGAATVAAVREAGGRPIALDRVPVDGRAARGRRPVRHPRRRGRRRALVDGAGGTLDAVVTAPAPTSAARSTTSTAPTGTAS